MYSKVAQLYICIPFYVLSITAHHRMLNLVPCAAQLHLTLYPLYI